MFSRDIALNYLLKFIGPENLANIDLFLEEAKEREYKEFTDIEEVMAFFKPILTSIYENNTLNDVDYLKEYSGIAYNKVNAILRNTWDYYKNGKLTSTDNQRARLLAENISRIIQKEPALDKDIKTFRGVTLTAFKSYGINNLNELVNLKGQYYYDQGFTSTSLLRGKSFFNLELEWHSKCDIEIEVLIPKESQDGIPLLTSELSYSNGQVEYLLNKGTLLKIIDVRIEDNKAYLKAILVPQRMWNLEMEQPTNKEFK